ncbi:MAG: gas vesicle protein [Candidatus Korobacteraceae bacterium]|jgi:gas vesicle structural protein
MSFEHKTGASLVAKEEFTLAETQKITLCEVLDRVLRKGAVIDGEATISVAGIDLVYLGLKLILTSIETARLAAAPAPMGSRQEGADGFR